MSQAVPGLVLERRQGRWSARRADVPAGTPPLPAQPERIARGRAWLLEWHRRLLPRDAAAALEFPKAVGAIAGEARVGWCAFVGDACSSPGMDRVAWQGTPSDPELADAARAAMLAGGRHRPARLRRALALVLATLTWLGAAARLPWRSALPETAGRWALLHGESSTRTRHLLARITAQAFDAVFVLGRPRAGLRRLRATLRAGAPAELPPIMLAGSLPTALGGMASALATAWRSLPEADAAPVPLPLRELGAIAFRIAWGRTQARAWQRLGPPGGEAWFGHTGTADVDALEQAMRAKGTRTLHVVHGLSTGLPFIARSDVGWFQCASDARWHASLGGYGACLAPDAGKPPLAVPGDSLLVVGNLAHPMNPAGPDAAVRAEAEVLLAARGAAGAAVTGLWRPHPAFATLPGEARDWLRRQAAAAGFEEAPPGPLAHCLARARWIVCTPSTMLVDLLRAGQVPVLWTPPGLAPESAPECHPLRARDVAGLAAAFAMLDDGAGRASLQDQAWRALGPSRPPRPGESLAEGAS